MATTQVIDPYLTGNFTPLRSEDDFELEVTGEIPAGLRGAFYRNGPNPQFEPRDEYHWFAGDGMVHAFFVEDGKVRYRNRYVRTPKWNVEHEAGTALFGTFGNPMTSDPSTLGKDSGVANTNAVWHGGHLYALEEGHQPFALDPLTLESLGYAEPYIGAVTAHPKLDPVTGEMIWFGRHAGEMPLNSLMAFGITDAAGKLTRRDTFETPFSSMVHDFLVTSRHALFPILPLTADLQRAMTGGPAFAWEPDKGAHVGVIRRDASVDSIRWFTTDACFVFHTMNAWEENDKIFADVMEYAAPPMFPDPDGSMGNRAGARLVRWTFDLADNSNTIKRMPIDDMVGDFPRLDERRAGLPYRHGWFAGISHGNVDLAVFDCISHVDVVSQRRVDYMFKPGDHPGEPVFVPRSADAEEGDGWLLTVVYRGETDSSDLAIFDAQNIEAGPIALAKVPRRVPFGFHGNWRPA